jgi:uncharacterized protein (DUF934 family)
MPLIKDGKLVADGFTAVADDAALPDGAIIVSLARFQKDRETLLARNTPLAVRLKADENPEKLGDDVQRFAAIILEFPKFRDGRAFSWARMLRTRLHFKGEIRVVGDFIFDQINYLHRVGVNAFEVPEGFTEQLYQKALSEMTYVYQPSTDGRRTIRDLRAH